jgi:hypothetical protein
MAHLYQRLTEIRDCLCEEISMSTPDVCYCAIVPGEAVVADMAGDCDVACGIAWVRLISAEPVAGVGIPAEALGPHGIAPYGAEMGMEVEVGVLRCYPINADGSPLSAEELEEATWRQVDDAEAIRKAILCCPALSEKNTMLREYTPMGPMGGYVGGNWRFQTVA